VTDLPTRVLESLRADGPNYAGGLATEFGAQDKHVTGALRALVGRGEAEVAERVGHRLYYRASSSRRYQCRRCGLELRRKAPLCGFCLEEQAILRVIDVAHHPGTALPADLSRLEAALT
jgi:hypothetical protein